MKLKITSEAFYQQDHSWLGSEHGVQNAVPISLKVSAFTEGTHYPKGFFPDGLAIAKPTSGANAGFGVPLAAKPNEGQTVTITGTPTGGTYTLTLDGETTAAIAYNATAATITTALEGLSNVRVGTVVVTGGPGPGTPWVVTFSGSQYQGTDVPQMSATSSLTGGTSPAVAVTTTTAGGSGATDGSDILAGFVVFPTGVNSGLTVVHAPLLELGRIITANLPIPLTAAQRATNSHFIWA
jgi:predicted RNA-binding protein with TRAM domain